MEKLDYLQRLPDPPPDPPPGKPPGGGEKLPAPEPTEEDEQGEDEQ